MNHQTKKIKAVLFDMDGTLLDTLDDLGDAVNAALSAEGYPLRTREEIRRFVGNGMPKLIERALPEGAPEGRVMERFKRHYALHGQDKTRPYEGIPALLGALKERGFGLAVVSNKAQSALERLCESMFPSVFSVVVGQRDGVPVKPAPDMPREALSRLGVSPEEACYLGDSEVDFLMGRNTDLFTVIALWGFRTRAELEATGAKEFIERPEEFLRYVP